jgi:cell division protein FtsZ
VTLQPLRQPAPQTLVMAEAMPETTMMEAMPAAAHPPPLPPVVAGTVSAPRPAPAAPRSGLFAEASRAVSVEPASEAAKPSLFSTVTGAFRRHQHHAPTVTAEPAPVRADPAPQDPRMEHPRVSVRQTPGDEVGLDIPAFLRRQSS